ncbi:MAG: hypothetical protein ACE5HQ_11955 [Gemmatimonadota bacterium]
MAYRNFKDRRGGRWEVRPCTRWEWDLEPLGGNPAARVRVRAPGYTDDPFELSEQELRRLLESARGSGAPAGRRPPSPFRD